MMAMSCTATPQGVLVSKIRTYKMAESLRNRVFTYTGGGRGGKLQMAEAMAFNRQTLGQIGSVTAGYDFPSDQKSYVTFFREHFDLFRDVHSRPDVAVLHSYASMGYNNDLPWQSAMLVEQALIQNHVPFDIVFDDQLRDLSHYRALVLPDQESLTDEHNGAGSASTSKAAAGSWPPSAPRSTTPGAGGALNFGLSDLLGVRAPKFSQNLYTFRSMPVMPGQPAASATSIVRAPAAPPKPMPPVRHTTGRGRSVYIASVRPAIQKPSGEAMTSPYWKLPLNAQEIVSEVKWAANVVSLDVKGPATLVVEPLTQGSSALLLHLLNYDVERRPSIENVEISVRLPQGKTAASVRLYSPDIPEAPALAHASKGAWLLFTVPRLQTYSIAKIELQPSYLVRECNPPRLHRHFRPRTNRSRTCRYSATESRRRRLQSSNQ